VSRRQIENDTPEPTFFDSHQNVGHQLEIVGIDQLLAGMQHAEHEFHETHEVGAREFDQTIEHLRAVIVVRQRCGV